MGGGWSRSWDGEAREVGGDPRAGESRAGAAAESLFTQQPHHGETERFSCVGAGGGKDLNPQLSKETRKLKSLSPAMRACGCDGDQSPAHRHPQGTCLQKCPSATPGENGPGTRASSLLLRAPAPHHPAWGRD